jgi:RimJ/RimL family protein N-acetyltransferase
MSAQPGNPLPADITVRGHGLVLREWRDADLPVMVGLFDDPGVAKWTPLPSPFDLAAARTYLARARDGRAAGRRIQLAITTDGHSALGEILLVPTDGSRTEVELAYAIGPLHRRQRLAVRAVALATEYAYDTLGASRVRLAIPPDNTASAATAAAAGFAVSSTPPIIRDGADQPLSIWYHRRGGQEPGRLGSARR